MEHLQAFIADCDRRTDAAKKRLAETQEELTAEVAVKANAVHQLAEEIGKKLAKAEALGEAGEVEESMQLMVEIDELRAKKLQAEQEYRQSMPASSYQQQKLRVCEVCSAYLGIHDNDIRLADHFGGKLHLGFMAIREKLTELEVCITFDYGLAYFYSCENLVLVVELRNWEINSLNSESSTFVVELPLLGNVINQIFTRITFNLHISYNLQK